MLPLHGLSRLVGPTGCSVQTAEVYHGYVVVLLGVGRGLYALGRPARAPSGWLLAAERVEDDRPGIPCQSSSGVTPVREEPHLGHLAEVASCRVAGGPAPRPPSSAPEYLAHQLVAPVVQPVARVAIRGMLTKNSWFIVQPGEAMPLKSVACAQYAWPCVVREVQANPKRCQG